MAVSHVNYSGQGRLVQGRRFGRAEHVWYVGYLSILSDLFHFTEIILYFTEYFILQYPCMITYSPKPLSNELQVKNTNWESLKDTEINKYTNNITEHIIKISTKHIPNKIINVRPSDRNWLNTNIKTLIRKRKRFYTTYKTTRANSDYEAYKK